VFFLSEFCFVFFSPVFFLVCFVCSFLVQIRILTRFGL
jgi:hypothetical protein